MSIEACGLGVTESARGSSGCRGRTLRSACWAGAFVLWFLSHIDP